MYITSLGSSVSGPNGAGGTGSSVTTDTLPATAVGRDDS